jgi:hypothetical protein
VKCKTCGIVGHDSQGDKELCLKAVVARLERIEGAMLLIASWDCTSAIICNAAGVGYEAVRIAKEAIR